MKTSNSLVSKLEDLLKQVEISSQDHSSFNKLNKANDHYNNLVKTGVIKKRGFTLRGIEDVHLLNGFKLSK